MGVPKVLRCGRDSRRKGKVVPKTLQDDREPASGKVSENKRTTQRYWQGFDYPGGLAADNLGDEAFDGLRAI